MQRIDWLPGDAQGKIMRTNHRSAYATA